MRRHFMNTTGCRSTLIAAIAGISSLVIFFSPVVADNPPPQTTQADFDQDGVDDQVVAEPNQSGSGPGQVAVYSGESGQTLGTLSGSESGDQFGFSISAGCDVNGDEVRDLLVGAPKESNGEGRAYVFLGPIRDEESLTPEDAYLTLHSPDQDTYDFGKRVECMEDLDEDGNSDVLVEASFLDQSQKRPRALIFSRAHQAH